MRSSRILVILVMLVTVLAAALPVRAASTNVTGAVYTTTPDCDSVNFNIYPDKQSVYLTGGPKTTNSPGLSPAGEWVWQITTPDGATLLSNEDISERTFTVGANGRMVGYAGSHGWMVCDSDTGRIGIELFPFDDSTNGGGVYKLWITPKDRYVDGQGSFGFMNSNSVTDNFKIGTGQPCDPNDPACNPVPLTSTVDVMKFFDTNGNGAPDPGEPTIDGWVMTLTNDSTQILATAATGSADPGLVRFTDLVNGYNYGVYETLTALGGMPGTGRAGFNWMATTPTYVSFTAASTNDNILFGNRCEALPTYGRTIGFWSNKNGQVAITNNNGLAYLATLGAHWYVPPTGSYNLTTYSGFKSYMLNANASTNTSMAWMLSAQLMASALSAKINGLNPGDTIVWQDGTSMTVQQLLDGAINALNTPLSRSEQEWWKNRLDAFNNNLLTTIVGAPSTCSVIYPLP